LTCSISYLFLLWIHGTLNKIKIETEIKAYFINAIVHYDPVIKMVLRYAIDLSTYINDVHKSDVHNLGAFYIIYLKREENCEANKASCRTPKINLLIHH
jgi:hypothetical protein